MPLSFSRLKNGFMNTMTPYQGLSHLIPASSSTQIKVLRAVSVVLALLTVGLATVASHLMCRFRYRHHYVALRQEEKRIYDLPKPFGSKIKLDLSSLEQFHPNTVDHFLADKMRDFTSVSCYKPCGYTEFLYSQFNRSGPSSEYEQRKNLCKERAEDFKDRYCFDNVKSMRFGEIGDEYWAAFPQAIGQLGRMNLEMIRGQKALEPETFNLLEDFKRALTDHNDTEAALSFMELAKIPNSLPLEFFYACFGDVRMLGLHPHVKLTKQLHEMKKLCAEFKEHSMQTIRAIVSYYEHAGFSDPITLTKVILKTIDPLHEYAIHDNKLLKINN